MDNTTKFDQTDYIIKMANKAFNEAFQIAKNNNLPIIKRENNKLIKIYANGKKEIIKTIQMVKIQNKTFSIK